MESETQEHDDWFDVDWDEQFDPQDESSECDVDDDLTVPSVDEITSLLSTLSEGTTELSEGATEHTGSCETVHEPVASPPKTPRPTDGPISTPTVPHLDEELREAFLDDAGQCVSAIENAILSYEADAKDSEPLRLIGRELHTLKGASASVGLTELAEFLHAIEDSIGTGDASSQNVNELPSAQDLLSRLDEVGKVIDMVRNQGAKAPPSLPDTGAETPGDSAPTPHAPINFDCGDDRSGDEESVRVKSSQLNRLMDMLAELVMLRNRRETELAELQEIYEEMVRGVCQVRAAGDPVDVESAEGPSSLPAIANDLMATAQRLRDCSQPVAEGNAAVSQFIRQFRQELVQLRRTPVSGLFRRLQRVVRDAAKAENKQVQLKLVGEDAGTERSLQQRLYEPLLHIVRNCVCHGIESPDGAPDRRKRRRRNHHTASALGRRPVCHRDS